MAAQFVIAGKSDCPLFVHGVYVARYLHKKLPNFEIKVVQKKTGDWEPWLQEINRRYRWHHTSSPIVWKELALRGGRAHYVGGLGEFWEYVYDYYALESIICKEDLKKLVKDNLQFLEETERNNAKVEVRKIGLIGVNHPAVSHVVAELLEIEGLKKKNGLTVWLYGEKMDYMDSLATYHDIVEDLQHLATNGEARVFYLAEDLEELLSGCDLLIYLGDYRKMDDETTMEWLVRNASAMFTLADAITSFGGRDIKIVLALDGPVCFDASMLLDTCTSVRIQNIVAVTADAGLGPLKFAAERAGIDLREFGGCPVWGNVGIDEHVDVEGAVIKADVFRPYRRILRRIEGSTLPTGTVESELRLASYLIEEPEKAIEEARKTRKKIEDALERPPCFAKVRAISSLLKIWYSGDDKEDRIISLGVCSNGAYGISNGIVFSQPAILVRGVWIPFAEFPVTQGTLKQIREELVPKYIETINSLNAEMRRKCQRCLHV